MKKGIIALCFLGAALTSGWAQTSSLKQTAKIKLQEVPVAVQLAFQTQFGDVPDGGYWTVSYVQSDPGSPLPTKPLYYSFIKRSRTEKIDVSFTPDGGVRYARGLSTKMESSGASQDSGGM